MIKKENTFRNSMFFLIGVLIYSFLFWLSGQNYIHVFGSILTALGCYLLYQVAPQSKPKKEKINSRDVIYICIGIIFDSFSSGFPFNILQPF